MSADSKINSAICVGKEFQKKLEYERVKITNRDATNFSPEDRWSYLISKPSKANQDTVEKNFIRYDIDDFLLLSSDSPPKNKYVRIAGYVHVKEDVIYVRDRENLSRKNVKIKLGNCVDYLVPGTLIELFGRVYFEKTGNKFLPHLHVYFHRELKGTYAEYVELYRMFKCLV